MRWFSRPLRNSCDEFELPSGLCDAISNRAYRKWIRRYDTLGAGDRAAIRRHIERLPRRPLVSVILTSSQARPAAQSHRSLRSIVEQLYPDWEIWLPAAAAGSPDFWARGDRRIRFMPPDGGETAAANAALKSAGGEFVVFLNAGDLLAEHALYMLAATLAANPEADLVYSDSDSCDVRGTRCWPQFKPDWDPDLALGQDLLGRSCAMRVALVNGLGGLREEFEPAAQYELRLRSAFSVDAQRIRHIPAVLHHCSMGPPAPPEYCSPSHWEAARRAVRQCRAAAEFRIEPVPEFPFWNRLHAPMPEPPPLVSVIVPTRDRADLLAECARGVLERTDYPALEFLVVDNDSVEESTFALFATLRGDPRVRIIRSPGPFNFSALVNLGVSAASGHVILLLNNDISVPSPGWLREMVSQALRPEIGAVGAKLIYPNGSVQHAGVALLPDGRVHHAFRLADRGDPGYFGRLALTRSCLAVTGACLAVRREVFAEAGGLDAENFAIAFNDIDLCLRIGARGYRVICTPLAELVHWESASRGSDRRGARLARARKEHACLLSRWPAQFRHDPYGNPNLTCTWDKRGVALCRPHAVAPWCETEGALSGAPSAGQELPVRS